MYRMTFKLTYKCPFAVSFEWVNVYAHWSVCLSTTYMRCHWCEQFCCNFSERYTHQILMRLHTCIRYACILNFSFTFRYKCSIYTSKSQRQWNCLLMFNVCVVLMLFRTIQIKPPVDKTIIYFLPSFIFPFFCFSRAFFFRFTDFNARREWKRVQKTIKKNIWMNIEVLLNKVINSLLFNTPLIEIQ